MRRFTAGPGLCVVTADTQERRDELSFRSGCWLPGISFLVVLAASGRGTFREDEAKVLQKKNLQEKFAGKSRTGSLGHQPVPSSWVGASLQPISSGRWGKSPREDPSKPSSIYALSSMSWGFAHWFIWET